MKKIIGAIEKEQDGYKIHFSIPNIFILDLNFTSEEILFKFYDFLKDNSASIKTSEDDIILNNLKFIKEEVLDGFVKLIQNEEITYDYDCNFKICRLVSRE